MAASNDSGNQDVRQRKPSAAATSDNNSETVADSNEQNANLGIFTPPQYQNYGCADAYAQAVRTWLWAYHSWQFAQAMAPFHIYQTMLNFQQNQNRQTTTGAQPPPSSGAVRTETVTPARGTQHVIATYGRRLLAELIDFSFCFVLKLVIVYFMVEVQLIDIEKYEKLLGEQADLKTFIDITQDLFPVEVANKVITSVLEALYITYGWGSVPRGFTPGKFLLGIKVISCDKVSALAPRDYRVIVEGEKPVALGISLLRSFIKNFCLSFLFPLCVTMYAFRYNRSLYDIASGTVVVEAPRR